MPRATPGKVGLGVQLTTEEHERLREVAAEHGRSMHQTVRLAIRHWLGLPVPPGEAPARRPRS